MYNRCDYNGITATTNGTNNYSINVDMYLFLDFKNFYCLLSIDAWNVIFSNEYFVCSILRTF